jgi:hypothetical protein
MSATTREQLHQQIDQLPDRIVDQIANFIQLVATKQNNIPEYANWKSKDWQEFSLQQFFRDEDEVEYTLEDAQEVYRQ